MYKLIHGEALEYLKTLDNDSADLVLFDPPYRGVLDDDWDNAWNSRQEFLDWLGIYLDEFSRIIKFNGSLFVFAYPDMAAFVEIEVWKRFHVLNSIVWNKRNGGAASRNDKEALRAFIPLSERIVFAEHYNSDNNAKGESGYQVECDHLRGFVFEPLRKYLADEFAALGWTADDLNRICETASMAGRHFTARSQWCLPTEEHYRKLQAAANDGHLRREYEDLRREYEDLRRPFNITASDQYSDVWSFNTSANEGTYHPAQKPLALLRYMITATTKPGTLVLDPMAGSCSTGVACLQTGRNFIGIERLPVVASDPDYFAIAERRIAQAAAQPPLFVEQPRRETVEQTPLFGDSPLTPGESGV